MQITWWKAVLAAGDYFPVFDLHKQLMNLFNADLCNYESSDVLGMNLSVSIVTGTWYEPKCVYSYWYLVWT